MADDMVVGHTRFDEGGRVVDPCIGGVDGASSVTVAAARDQNGVVPEEAQEGETLAEKSEREKLLCQKCKGYYHKYHDVKCRICGHEETRYGLESDVCMNCLERMWDLVVHQGASLRGAEDSVAAFDKAFLKERKET